jgi:hypothetical protein
VDRFGVLNYQTASLVNRTTLQYVWGENIKGVTGSHSPQFSKNIEVQVHSWTKLNRTASVARVNTNINGGVTVMSYTRQVTSTPIFGTTEALTTSVSSTGTVTESMSTASGGAASASTGTSSVGSDTGREKYVYFVRNKTKAQCIQIAQNIWRQISMHEFAITLEAPVTAATLTTMDVTASIQPFGIPMAAFNSEGPYWPREITEDFDPHGAGFAYTITAVNHELALGAIEGGSS